LTNSLSGKASCQFGRNTPRPKTHQAVALPASVAAERGGLAGWQQRIVTGYIEDHLADLGSPSNPSLEEHSFLKATGIYLALAKIALSAVAWFLAVMWLNFFGGLQLDLVPAIVIGFFVMSFTLLLLAVPTTIGDHWRPTKDGLNKSRETNTRDLNALAFDRGPRAARKSCQPGGKPR